MGDCMKETPYYVGNQVFKVKHTLKLNGMVQIDSTFKTLYKQSRKIQMSNNLKKLVHILKIMYYYRYLWY